ncbi:hypothetical protein SAMN04489740_4176 [Arthrobacter alpinus]|uniref:Uncharacterized protein n=1 Tax=Arthrobacter alpinus TaxID=656366 RepID=A0A1H5PEJ4_9MICC|nr:hypothetical protein [Arthrobacter alpinus]SEF12044.1 hypothetical protein SAMN04489740_4176 [Arthrobacter alpinus]
MKNLGKHLLALPLVVAMLFTFGIASASAAAPDVAPAAQTVSLPSSANGELTPAQVAQALLELKASSLPRVSETVGSTVQTRFQLTADFGMTFVEPAVGVIAPRIGGGFDGGGPYILLNQFDQDAIISGAGLALGAAICAIPAVGWAACTAVGVIIAAAVIYLSYNGKCNNNKQLKVYVSGRIAGCV